MGIVLSLFVALLLLGEAVAADYVMRDNVQLQPGSDTFGPVTIPNGFIGCRLRVARSQWRNPMASLEIWIETSVDDGASWQVWGGIADHGGTQDPRGRFSGREDHMYIESRLPEGTGRKARGGYTVFGGSVRTTIVLQCI